MSKNWIVRTYLLLQICGQIVSCSVVDSMIQYIVNFGAVKQEKEAVGKEIMRNKHVNQFTAAPLVYLSLFCNYTLHEIALTNFIMFLTTNVGYLSQISLKPCNYQYKFDLPSFLIFLNLIQNLLTLLIPRGGQVDPLRFFLDNSG